MPRRIRRIHRRFPQMLTIVRHQTGRTRVHIDKKRRALKSGKRRSASGNIYWETRKNRSDVGRWL